LGGNAPWPLLELTSLEEDIVEDDSIPNQEDDDVVEDCECDFLLSEVKAVAQTFACMVQTLTM
jgi:hypothetical protein